MYGRSMGRSGAWPDAGGGPYEELCRERLPQEREGRVRRQLVGVAGEVGRGGSITHLYRDTRREHHPGGLHACELRSRRRRRRLARPSPLRPRRRFLLRATRPHFPNPHLRGWTIPANLRIARPSVAPVLPAQIPRYPRFGFFRERVS